MKHNPNCLQQESLTVQGLADKLAVKSNDLYIVWQNYNQMYQLLGQRMTEISHLKQEIEQLRRQRTQFQDKSQQGVSHDDSFLKERFMFLERTNEQFRIKSDQLMTESQQLRIDNKRLQEENVQLHLLLQQLKEQNCNQHNRIEKILIQLKAAQTDIEANAKIYEQFTQKQILLSKYAQQEQELRAQIADMEKEIYELNESKNAMRIQCEQITKQSLNNARNKVQESLSGLIGTSNQGNWQQRAAVF